MAAPIVVTGQMIMIDLVADGTMEYPEDGWNDIRKDMEPHGFSWSNGWIHIPGDLCAWWTAVLKGEHPAWPRGEAS